MPQLRLSMRTPAPDRPPPSARLQDGLDQKLTLHYWSRMALLTHLLPMLVSRSLTRTFVWRQCEAAAITAIAHATVDVSVAEARGNLRRKPRRPGPECCRCSLAVRLSKLLAQNSWPKTLGERCSDSVLQRENKRAWAKSFSPCRPGDRSASLQWPPAGVHGAPATYKEDPELKLNYGLKAAADTAGDLRFLPSCLPPDLDAHPCQSRDSPPKQYLRTTTRTCVHRCIPHVSDSL